MLYTKLTFHSLRDNQVTQQGKLERNGAHLFQPKLKYIKAKIEHLHASPNEFISKFTSWLDAVVAYANVLHPMEN